MFKSNAAVPRPLSAYGGDSETEMDGATAEIELHKVQRSLRQLEAERKAYAEKVRTTINTQNASLDKLRRDNEFLTQEARILKLQMMDDMKKGAGSQKADSLKQQIEYLQRKIKDDSAEYGAVEKALAEKEKQYAKKRAAIGLAPKKSGDTSSKAVVAMANRLDKTLVRMNKLLEGNAKIREDIDVMRYDRLAFNGVYKKFERELMDLKRQMSESLRGSTAAYEAREEAQSRMIVLKERTEKEHQVHLQELKELERQIEQDKRLREFMYKKTAGRIDSPSIALSKSSAQSGNKGSQDSLSQRLEEFSLDMQQYKDIEEFPDNIEEVVQQFSTLEDENFSLFNFVNEMNNQIISLNSEISNMTNTNRRESTMVQKINDDKRAKASELNAEIQEIKQKREKYIERQKTLNSIMESVVVDLNKIYSLLGLPDIPEGGESIVEKEAIILQKLRTVESKTSELLMKNLLANLPKKYTNAASSNPSDKHDGDEVLQDTQYLADMLQTARKNSTQGNETMRINSIIGNGPVAPVKNIKADHSILSGDEDFEAEPMEELDNRLFTRNELTEKTSKNIERRMSEKKIERDRMGSMTIHAVAAKSTNPKKKKNVGK